MCDIRGIRHDWIEETSNMVYMLSAIKLSSNREKKLLKTWTSLMNTCRYSRTKPRRQTKQIRNYQCTCMSIS